MFNLLLAIIYMSFVSLGLPDGLLGAAWPSMYPEIGVSVSMAGIISMVIAFGTVVSALLSDRITCKIGTGKITAISVGMTCISMFGFSFCNQYWMLIMWAIPYGLGAGGVDAALNNYVAVHYTSRHMSWLHCMWGLGASIGPYIMGAALSYQSNWNSGYRWVGIIQAVLTAILIFSIPIWRKRPTVENENGEEVEARPMKLSQIVKVKGVPEILFMFFCYCAIESTTGLWAASFLTICKGVDAVEAASMASLFYIGITVGRAVNGFLTIKYSDKTLIRMGQVIILCGIAIMLIPVSNYFAFAGIVMIGLGCAPIYPCIIHSTPAHFGGDKSQAIVGVQMASAYVGTLTMPAVFGLIGQNINMALFPVFLFAVLIVMSVMHEILEKKTAK